MSYSGNSGYSGKRVAFNPLSDDPLIAWIPAASNVTLINGGPHKSWNALGSPPTGTSFTTQHADPSYAPNLIDAPIGEGVKAWSLAANSETRWVIPTPGAAMNATYKMTYGGWFKLHYPIVGNQYLFSCWGNSNQHRIAVYADNLRRLVCYQSSDGNGDTGPSGVGKFNGTPDIVDYSDWFFAMLVIDATKANYNVSFSHRIEVYVAQGATLINDPGTGYSSGGAAPDGPVRVQGSGESAIVLKASTEPFQYGSENSNQCSQVGPFWMRDDSAGAKPISWWQKNILPYKAPISL